MKPVYSTYIPTDYTWAEPKQLHLNWKSWKSWKSKSCKIFTTLMITPHHSPQIVHCWAAKKGGFGPMLTLKSQIWVQSPKARLRLSISRPKSKFLIWIVVFDEHELIVYVIQGLSLSTARLVIQLFGKKSQRSLLV